MRTEVAGSLNAMEAALAAGVRRVVCTSSFATVGEAKGQVGNEETVHRLFAVMEERKAKRTGKPPLLVVQGFRADGGKACRELGIQYTPIEKSVRQAVRWYWEQGLLKRKPTCVE